MAFVRLLYLSRAHPEVILIIFLAAVQKYTPEGSTAEISILHTRGVHFEAIVDADVLGSLPPPLCFSASSISDTAFRLSRVLFKSLDNIIPFFHWHPLIVIVVGCE